MEQNKGIGIALICLFGVSVISAFFVIILQARESKPQERAAIQRSIMPTQTWKANSIAVLNIFSPIQYVSDDTTFPVRREGALYWLDLLKTVEENPNINALIIRINSPGGTIAATQEIYNQILRIREKGKTVVVSMGDLCASGGYYIASAADYIVANRGTLTGSIGVIMAGVDLSDLFKRYGIEYNVIKSGEFKDSGTFFRKMTPEERRLLESVVMDAYNQFFEDVASARDLSPSRLRPVADGRILTARQALDAGLIDELGDFQDTVRITAEKASIKDPELIELRPDMKRMLRFFTANYDKLLKSESPSINLIESPQILKDSFVPIMYMFTY
jgi:protease-4